MLMPDELMPENAVTTLADLEEQKRELEARLDDGDISAEAALARVDRAIASRKQTIAHSQKRLGAARDAVAAGMPAEQARARQPKGGAKKPAKAPGRRPLNRFE